MSSMQEDWPPSMCSKKSTKAVKKVSVEKDFDDPNNWNLSTDIEATDENSSQEIVVRQVSKKNVVSVTVGS